MNLMNPECGLCPRQCRARRVEGKKGICGADHRLRVASHNLHFGEEPPISGSRGSGTIFLAHCNLSCVYCQNYPISQLGNGSETDPDELAGFMLSLQKRGAHNINWVTPTHETAHLLEALFMARSRGLVLPVVYNSSGYDSVEVLRLLEGIVDIYMPDMRYAEGEVSLRYSGAVDYPGVNREVVLEMHRQVGDLRLDPRGIARRGLLVRHLVLPGGISGTEKIFRFLSEEVSKKTAVSLMSQYFPAYKAREMDGIDRRIHRDEYEEALRLMKHFGLTEGWRQVF